MAYNIEPLIRILDEILKPNQETQILDNRNELDYSLFQTILSLKHVLEGTSHVQSKTIEALEIQIRDAAHEAEDILEPNMLDEMLPKPMLLSKVIEKFDAVIAEFMKIKDDDATLSPLNVAADSTISNDPSSTKHDIVVGFDEDVLRLKDRLTSQATKLQIIPIIGMGGIGKTTLAQQLYNDPLIRSHFDVRAWATVSQSYSFRAILLNLLGCIIGKLSDEMLQEKDDKLALLLHKSLYGRRYLIIIDDIWSSKAWDEIKVLFPRENCRSRILLTTRESHVGKHADPSCIEHQMHLLNDLQSWELLRDKVFGNESCPPELERIGKKITKNCRGLPLAIRVIGGVLSNSKEKNSEDLWERIAGDVSSFVAENDEQFPNILTLSYNHLPYYLKPCLLYMAAFPEDYEVSASKLKNLWIAEGFLKPFGGNNMADEYLKALVDRNLLIVRQYKSNGKAKSYSIHDLLRELCVKKAREDKFLFVKNWKVEVSNCNLRRVSVHSSYQIRDVCNSEEQMSLARSFLYIGGLAHHDTLSPVFLPLKLLRVLDVLNLLFDRFPEQVLQLVNLRLLTVTAISFLPPEISRLQNLQTLIAKLHSRIPSELWEMLELRHLEMKNLVIEFEPEYLMTRVQEKLQTLSRINLCDLTRTGMLMKIPNIKKLGVHVSSCDERVVDLSHLNCLETLMFTRTIVLGTAFESIPEIEFPQSINKLTLYAFMLPQSFLSSVSLLPNLQVLKIRICDFDEEEWEPDEGGFQSLQFLLLEDVNLVSWKADNTHFPKLRHMEVRKCAALEEIPNSFGNIETLEKLELVESSNPSLLASVRLMEDEQSEYGNETLHILIRQ